MRERERLERSDEPDSECASGGGAVFELRKPAGPARPAGSKFGGPPI